MACRLRHVQAPGRRGLTGMLALGEVKFFGMNFKQPVSEVHPQGISFEIRARDVASKHIAFQFRGVERAIKPGYTIAFDLI